jgi:hypothetical protein
MRSLWTALLLTGCTSDPITDDVTQADKSIEEPAPPENPTPWEYEGDPPSVQFDQAKVEASISAAIDQILIITSDAPLDAYLTVMETADEVCPYNSVYEGSAYWYGGCTTLDGTRFDGYSFYEEHLDSPLWGDGSNMSGTTLNTQGTVVFADGTRFDMGGGAMMWEGTVFDGETYGWFTSVNGTFGWSDDELDESWMGGPIRPTFQTVAYLWTLGDGSNQRGVQTTSGFGGLDAEWDTVYLSEVFSVDSLGGYIPCTEEPSGTISVRSTGGEWFQVVYDVEQGNEGWTVVPGACDGCGTVFASGEAVGEACNDFSALRDWEDQPW